jgi:hypothetical protein
MKREVRHRLSVIGILVINILFILTIVHDAWFLEERQLEFFGKVFDALSLRAGQAVIIGSLLVLIATTVRRGVPAPIKKTTETVSQWIVESAAKLFSELSRSAIAEIGLTLLALVLGFYWLQTSPRFFPPLSEEASQMLVTPDGYIYVANPNDGMIEWSTIDAPLARMPSIGVYSEGGAERGRPVRLALMSQTKWEGRKNGDKILATDETHHDLLLIDRHSYQIQHIPLGVRPQRMVITPDAEKAYISTEQPIPGGPITVVDLKATPFPRVMGQITGIGCPEGMAIAGDHLYVATQCGWGNDPVFVINTATDLVETKIAGLAVGSIVAFALRREPFPWLPKKKLYVTKSPEQHPELSRLIEYDASSVTRLSEIRDLKIIDTERDDLLTLPPDVAPLLHGAVSIAVARLGKEKADRVFFLSPALELKTLELNSVLP